MTNYRATLETKRKQGRVNFRKDFWGCYKGKLVTSIADRRVPSSHTRNNCRTNFWSTSLLVSKVAILEVRIEDFFGNHTSSKFCHSCSKSHLFCFKSHHFSSISYYFCFEYNRRCKAFLFPLFKKPATWLIKYWYCLNSAISERLQ